MSNSENLMNVRRVRNVSILYCVLRFLAMSHATNQYCKTAQLSMQYYNYVITTLTFMVM